MNPPPPADDPRARETASFSTRRPDDTMAPEGEGEQHRGWKTQEDRFRVQHLHAEGGLGSVWMAEDLDLKRQVALKEIRAKHADAPSNRIRFLQEAEITGRLEHPGVVPVYALGERADGRPFYVMRFIRGESMQDAIAAHHARSKRRSSEAGGGEGESTDGRAWTQRQLLGRFVAVCEAVAYAHSRGVLHRDLKPDNVMLGNYGETLVVDWGLAKPSDGCDAPPATDSNESMLEVTSGSATRLGSAIGTPGYMSPEQARGDLSRLTPATDVYSLGATLYCLLTGRRPIEDSRVQNVLEATSRGDFQSPRKIAGDVPRPLESIVLRAMALEPHDRYESAHELGQDVQRYLDDEPVLAHRDSLWERSGRWVRRHRSGVIAGVAAALLLAVVSTTAATMIAQSRNRAMDLADANKELADKEHVAREEAQQRQAEAEAASRKAERQKARAEKYLALAIGTVDEFLTNVSEDERLKAVGLQSLRQDLLVQARDFYELVIEQAEDGEDPLYERRINALERLASISQEVGQYDAAIESYRQALTLFDEMDAADINPYDYYVVVNDLALALEWAGAVSQAQQRWESQIDGLQELLKEEPDNADYHDLLATGQLNLARIVESWSVIESIQMSEQALKNVAQALRLDPGNEAYLKTKALLHNNVASSWIAREDVARAQPHLEEARQIWETMRESATGAEADALDDLLGLLHINLAMAAVGFADDQRATEEIDRALRLRREIAQRHPEVVQVQSRLADTYEQAAIHLRKLTRYDDALIALNEMLKIYRKLHEQQPTVPAYQSGLAQGMLEMAVTQFAMGAMKEGLTSLEQALQRSQKLVDQDPDQYEYLRLQAISRYYRGLGLLEEGSNEAAYETLNLAAKELKALTDERPHDVAVLSFLCDCQGRIASVLGDVLLNRPLESTVWWLRARETADRLLGESLADRVPPSTRRETLIDRAYARTGLLQYDQALADWNEIMQADGDVIDFEVGVGKATTLFRMSRFDEALEVARRTAEAQEHPAIIYAIAREVALGIVALSEMELPADEKAEWLEQFSAAAVEMLKLAKRDGYFSDSEAAEFLSEDPYLAPLRPREDFQALLESLESE